MCEQNSTEIPTACSTHTHTCCYTERGVEVEMGDV